MSLKAETEMAMKLLEKDIHEKQDTIVSLRRQLDDIKSINLEMYRKLQVRIVLNLRHTIQQTHITSYLYHTFISLIAHPSCRSLYLFVLSRIVFSVCSAVDIRF